MVATLYTNGNCGPVEARDVNELDRPGQNRCHRTAGCAAVVRPYTSGAEAARSGWAERFAVPADGLPEHSDDRDAATDRYRNRASTRYLDDAAGRKQSGPRADTADTAG